MKITDEAVEAAIAAFHERREAHDQWAGPNSMRAALEAALPHMDTSCDHICMGECATGGCENCGLHYYGSGGVGSYYCGACLRKIKALTTKPEVANAIITHSLDEQLRGIDDAIRAGYEARNVIVGSALYPAPVGVTPTHRHKKRGTEYVLIGIGKMQAEGWFAKVPGPGVFASDHTVDMREVAIYRSVDDGSLWVRPREEFEDGRFEALASHEPAPTDTQEGVNEAGEVVAWAAFDLEADFMAAFANERAVSGYVERVGEGAIHPLVRQSALTACQQEVERLTQEQDEALEAENEAKDCFWAIYPDWVDMKGHGITTEAARTLLADRAETAEARNAELVKALERFDPQVIGSGPSTDMAMLHDAQMLARAALKGQSNE